MKRFPHYFRNMAKTVTASGFQFALTLVTTPIMTRLYAPAAYADFGISYQLAGCIVGVGLLSMTNAYPIEKDEEQRGALIRTMLLQLIALLLITSLVAVVIHATQLLAIGLWSLVLLPLLVVTLGLRQMLVSIATAHTNFNRVALGQMVEPICSRGGSVGLGAAFGGQPAFILLSIAAGQVAVAAGVFQRERREILKRLSNLSPFHVKPWVVIRRYHDFAVYNTLTQQTQPLAMLAIQALIAAIFSPEQAGFYILASSILTLPASLIAMATAPITYRHFIDVGQRAPQDLAKHYLRFMAMYLIAGAAVLSPIFLFGEWIFTIAFGAMWAKAGHVASVLSVAFVSVFAVIGVQSVFRITRDLKRQFLLEVVLSLVTVIGTVIAFNALSFDAALVALCALIALRNIALLAAGVWYTSRYAQRVES